MTTSNSFCFIPAKAASERLKKKNILKLGGKELIYYPICNAIESNLFDKKDIILSTESEEIAGIAKKYGANTPYLRDAKLAKDPYGVVDVLLNFLDLFESYKKFENVCILLPTAPLTKVKFLLESFQVFQNQGKGVVMSVTETEHNAYRSVVIENDTVKPIFNQYISKKSQELSPTYRINGAIIWIKIQALLNKKSYFVKPWGAYVMPPNASIDIDNEIDYQMAQFFYNLNNA